MFQCACFVCSCRSMASARFAPPRLTPDGCAPFLNDVPHVGACHRRLPVPDQIRLCSKRPRAKIARRAGSTDLPAPARQFARHLRSGGGCRMPGDHPPQRDDSRHPDHHHHAVPPATGVSAPTAATAPHEHGAHSPRHAAGHDKHAGHSVEMFRQKFWGTLLLSVPSIIWSPMIQRWFRYTAPGEPSLHDGCQRFSARSCSRTAAGYSSEARSASCTRGCPA